MKKVDLVALLLLIIGGLNWGFYGVVNFNFIEYIFQRHWIVNVIYFLVGISAVYALVGYKHFLGKIKKG